MKTNNKNRDASIETNNSKALPSVLVDYERYTHFLEDADLTDAEKREFIEAIWGIITDFVALGFNVHPLQQSGQQTGQQSGSQGDGAAGDEIENSLPFAALDMVSSTASNPTKNNKAAPAAKRLEREES